MSLPIVGELELDNFKGSFQLQPFYDNTGNDLEILKLLDATNKSPLVGTNCFVLKTKIVVKPQKLTQVFF